MHLEQRYLVLKVADIDAALSMQQQLQLAELCSEIFLYRRGQGKKENRYLVVNHDEPYFEQVAHIVLEHIDNASQDVSKQ